MYLIYSVYVSDGRRSRCLALGLQVIPYSRPRCSPPFTRYFEVIFFVWKRNLREETVSAEYLFFMKLYPRGKHPCGENTLFSTLHPKYSSTRYPGVKPKKTSKECEMRTNTSNIDGMYLNKCSQPLIMVNIVLLVHVVPKYERLIYSAL